MRSQGITERYVAFTAQEVTAATYGCWVVRYLVGGTAVAMYFEPEPQSVYIYNSDSYPEGPELYDAQFGDSGVYIFITLSGDSDLAAAYHYLRYGDDDGDCSDTSLEYGNHDDYCVTCDNDAAEEAADLCYEMDGAKFDCRALFTFNVTGYSEFANFTDYNVWAEDQFANCFFTGLDTITMTLASTSNLVPGSVLELVEERLKAPCIYTISKEVIGNCYGDKRTKGGFPWNTETCSAGATDCPAAGDNMPVKLLDPDNALVPTIVFAGPETLGYCDDLLIDASGSQGNGGRAFTYGWSVTGLKISDALDEVTDASTSSEFEAAYYTLDAGYSFVFTLSLTNFLGGFASGEFSITKASSSLPTLKILGGTELTAYRSHPLSVFSEAKPPWCLDMSLAYKYTFVSGSTYGFLSYNSSSVDQRFLKLPAYYLVDGETYYWTVQVTDLDTLESNSLDFTVTIGYGDPVVSVNGGLYAQVHCARKAVAERHQ